MFHSLVFPIFPSIIFPFDIPSSKNIFAIRFYQIIYKENRSRGIQKEQFAEDSKVNWYSSNDTGYPSSERWFYRFSLKHQLWCPCTVCLMQHRYTVSLSLYLQQSWSKYRQTWETSAFKSIWYVPRRAESIIKRCCVGCNNLYVTR